MEEDASGLTFQEWTPDVDTSRSPVDIRLHTRGAGLRSLENMGPKRFVLSVDDDTEFRSRCE